MSNAVTFTVISGLALCLLLLFGRLLGII